VTSEASASRSDRVLLCVSGGIAAYKAPELVRAFVRAGIEVQVVMTPAAHSFVTPMALTTVSRRPVRTTLLDVAEEGRVGHIDLADWPDLVVVAPATADLLARAAAGMADDLASTVLLATRAPVLWAPAMNTNMWSHPATRANLATLTGRGARFVGPDRGDLACGWVGEGRMIDPEHIVDASRTLLASAAGENWSGRRVLVSAGPTRAYVDPVRFFTNASTGEMGFALAEVAARRGAEVVLVAGPVERATPPGVSRVDVETTDEMLTEMDRVLAAAPVDLVAMVAAVSDLAPANASPEKLPKGQLLTALGASSWVASVDVLRTLVGRHRARGFFLGFGAQTVQSEDPAQIEAALVAAGREKLAAKGCDAIFVNRVGAAGTGFASATNAGVLLAKGDGELRIERSGPPVEKRQLAAWLLDELAGTARRSAAAGAARGSTP
jgi:phosphopantothenoylcysteine decarboxylase / phosphopantothenate---cysteine ligase